MPGVLGIMGSFVFIVILTGALLAFTPWLMKKQECFAVTIPESAQSNAQLRAYKHRYAVMVLIVTVFACAIMCVLFLIADQQTSLMTVGILTGTLLPVIVSFVLMLYYRRKVMMLKVAEGWIARKSEASAVVAEYDFPKAISLKWDFLYLAVIGFTALVSVVAYPLMPDTIPMHVDFSGQVTDYEPKSIGVVAFPVLVQIFMGICFVFCHWSILRSKHAIDSDRPITSALAYGLFARAQSIFLLVVGVVISVLIGFCFILSSLGWLSLSVAGVCIALVTMLVLVGAIALSVVYGQSGSRIMRRLESSSEISTDNDKF